MRVVLGFVAALLAVPLAIFVVFSVMQILGLGWQRGTGFFEVMIGTLTFSWVAVPMALGVILLFALPTYIVSARRGRSSLFYYVVVGLVLGALPFLLFDIYVAAFDLWQAARSGWEPEYWGLRATCMRLLGNIPIAAVWLGMGALCGAAGSIAFWSIAVRPVRAADAQR
jgi:hypothetical protein